MATGGLPKFLPSAEQIEAGCKRAQRKWNEMERQKRETGLSADEVRELHRWTPPVVHTFDTSELESI